jgi:hypothetical protein
MELSTINKMIMDSYHKIEKEKPLQFSNKPMTLRTIIIGRSKPNVYVKNSDNSYMNPEQIFNDLINNRITNKDYIKKLASEFKSEYISKVDTSKFQFITLETRIRNSYGIWEPDYPYKTNSDDPNGVFPDSTSYQIVAKLVEYFKVNKNE